MKKKCLSNRIDVHSLKKILIFVKLASPNFCSRFVFALSAVVDSLLCSNCQQKKSPDSDGKKKRSKKRSRKHGR